VESVRAEQLQAHAVLGVRFVQYLDFPAPRSDTVPRHQLSDAIGKVLCEFQPHTVYIPHHGDMHFEHGLVYQCCLVAARPVNPGAVARILAYETLSETEWSPPTASACFQPTVYINIEQQLEQKLKAIECFRSQLKPPPHPRSVECVKALATLRGATAHLHAAEAFMLVREIETD
jgi:LmbE family N-acetylglucosaminyl deacetylase